MAKPDKPGNSVPSVVPADAVAGEPTLIPNPAVEVEGLAPCVDRLGGGGAGAFT